MPDSLLAQYLAESGETQHAFAARIGVSDSAMSSWILGSRGPDITSAALIERATEGRVPVTSWVRQDRRRKGLKKPLKQAG